MRFVAYHVIAIIHTMLRDTMSMDRSRDVASHLVTYCMYYFM
jgi:hypothetical protein